MFRLSLFKCTLLLFDAGFNSKNQITANKRQKRPSGQDSVYRGREWQGTTKPEYVDSTSKSKQDLGLKS